MYDKQLDININHYVNTNITYVFLGAVSH